MPRNIVPLALLFVTLTLVVAAMLITSQQLPARVASHFNAAGAPDGWMSRDWYVGSMIAMTIGLAVFLLAAFSLPRFVPVGTINLPNRDYWLAPERRQQTCRTIFRYGVGLAMMVTIQILAVHLLVVAANAAQPANLSNAIWIILAVFLLAVIVWSVFFIRRFCVAV